MPTAVVGTLAALSALATLSGSPEEGLGVWATAGSVVCSTRPKRTAPAIDFTVYDSLVGYDR
jgi:hypothetical protein